MKIDRHNYEEYFILYMDNELSSDERRMVEAFAQQHPDLKDELDILLQYKTEPDTSITFGGKEELMKINGETPILLSNYEECLLLYTDNELSAAQRKAVEQFVTANPFAKKELELLQNVRLQPETILFADKEFLYRKEEKVRRLPYMRWAAAAIVLFTAGLTALIILNNKPVRQADLVNSSNEKKSVPPSPVEINTPDKQVATVPLQNIPDNNTANHVKDNHDDVIKSNKQMNAAVPLKNNLPSLIKNNPANSTLPVKNNEPVLVENKPTNNLPQPLYNPAANGNAPKDAVVKNNAPTEINKTKTTLTNVDVTTANPQPSDLVNASFTEEGGNKKSKLRGIFRKVSRTFEKRTDINATDGADRLLVAGLSFKVK